MPPDPPRFGLSPECLYRLAPPLTRRKLECFIRPATELSTGVAEIPEAVDDFLRNFLRRAGLSRTLNRFEAEWYGSAQKLLTETLPVAAAGFSFVPDALTHGQLLRSELETVRRDTDRLRQEVLVAGEALVRMQRERDFHRLQYRRVAGDKNRLIEDFKELKKHLQSYEPALRQLEDKYQAALRHKMLISLKKDRLQNTTDARQNQEKSQTTKEKSVKKSDSAGKSPAKSPISSRHPKDTEFPAACSRLVNPHLAQVGFEKCKSAGSFSLSYSIRAHTLPISCIDLHPRKLILASASDDRSWRLEIGFIIIIAVGMMHLCSCATFPGGNKDFIPLLDCSSLQVRLWDFSRGRCVLTLPGHSQPTWGCSFHACGHFLASCSADRTAKLWDLNSQRCRLTLRHHAASVNSVCFLPSSNLLLTCSADKSLAVWDARLGVCGSTFRGHQHPCNHASSNPAGDVLASCDSRGVVNLWDIRKPAAPMATVDTGPSAANQVTFSPSGKMLAVASSDGLVRVVEVGLCVASSLSGHRDGVQSVTFDHTGETVMSAGSDGLINIWA
uniref:Sperm-associated antigen 16 protein n=1 Tax=Sander lucioperca TaxID=283035 RepID=A0A8C9ZKH4_SANLU